MPRPARALLAPLLLAVIVAIAPPALAGCSSASEAETIARSVTTGDLAPGDHVPAPKGPVVLTLRGRIGETNVGDELQFDLATLERLGLHEYRADDYQAEGHVVRFRGVLLDRLLAVADADPDATTLGTVALNDYKADVPVRDAERYPVLVATSVDGKRMSVARYGPTRFVYPNLAIDFDKTVYDARWVWQLDTVTVR